MRFNVIVVSPSQFDSIFQKFSSGYLVCVKGVPCEMTNPDVVGHALEKLNYALKKQKSVKDRRFNDFVRCLRGDLAVWFEKKYGSTDTYQLVTQFRALILNADKPKKIYNKNSVMSRLMLFKNARCN